MLNLNKIKIELSAQPHEYEIIRKGSKHMRLQLPERIHGYKIASTNECHINMSYWPSDKQLSLYIRHKSRNISTIINFFFYVNVTEDYVIQSLKINIGGILNISDIDTIIFLDEPILSSKISAKICTMSTLEYNVNRCNPSKLRKMLEFNSVNC